MKTTIFAALFIAIVGRLMADEVKAWTDWLHKRLRRRAVAKLPLELRERYNEEWEGGLEETPGEIFKIIYSMGLFRASSRIRRVAQTGALRRETPVLILVRRLLDIGISSMALIAMSPLMLAVAVAIKLESRGPAFYGSKHIGKKGRIFRCIKFRTMVRDPFNEPRITMLGRFLRKYSLDELPQLFNVLKGDMSIVGPRPQLAGEIRYGLEERLRRELDVMPGITGFWQLLYFHRRSDPQCRPTINEMYKVDWSIWLYIKSILCTVVAVFAGAPSNPSLTRGIMRNNGNGRSAEELDVDRL